MNHCLKWLKHSGSLEHMTLDLMNLTPGQASEEVDPEVLRARMMSQVHDTLQQEVLQQVTTGTQFAMKAGKEKVRQRGGVLPSAKGKEHQVFSEVWKLAGKGLVFVFPPEAIPLLNKERVRISPFGLVEKKHLGKPTGKL